MSVYIQEKMCIRMFEATSFMVAQLETTQRPSEGQWICKWYINSDNRLLYSSYKEQSTDIYTTWVNFTGVMTTTSSHTHRTMNLFIRSLRTGKLICGDGNWSKSYS